MKFVSGLKSSSLWLWDRLLFFHLMTLTFPSLVAWLSVCSSHWWVVLCGVARPHTDYPFSWWCTLTLFPGFNPVNGMPQTFVSKSLCGISIFKLGMYRSGISGSYMSLLLFNFLINCQFSKVNVFYIPISSVCQNLILSVFSIWDSLVNI